MVRPHFLPTIDQNLLKLILHCCKSDICIKSIRGVVAMNHIVHIIIVGYICASVWAYSDACLNLLHHSAVSWISKSVGPITDLLFGHVTLFW